MEDHWILHCGVLWGVFPLEALWDMVVVQSTSRGTFNLGVAWSLLCMLLKWKVDCITLTLYLCSAVALLLDLWLCLL